MERPPGARTHGQPFCPWKSGYKAVIKEFSVQTVHRLSSSLLEKVAIRNYIGCQSQLMFGIADGYVLT